MRFRVRYADPAELVADAGGQFDKGGFLVRVEPPDGAALYAAAELVIELDGEEVAVGGQVVQLIPGVGVAIGFRPPPALQALVDAARSRGGGGAAAEHLFDGAGDGPEADEQADEADDGDVADDGSGEARDASAAGKAKAEAIHRARYGSKDERMQIMRGHKRMLHRYVIQNPGLGVDEVVHIAKLTHVAPDVLMRIAERREWAQRPEVAIALVRNPKTPVPLAIKMLQHVAPAELRQLAKGTTVRMPILQAARKRVISR